MSPMPRRSFLTRLMAAGWISTRCPAFLSDGRAAAAISMATDARVKAPPFRFAEWDIATLQSALQEKEMTSLRLTRAYLQRIQHLDQAGPLLRSVIELNPDAEAIARERDAERKSGKLRGPLHGIPILIKDNIDTADRMHTTAGSLALADWIAPTDAFLVRKLRDAGAVLLGKTNLSEWANFRSSRSTSGWSGRGGQTRNPYALDRNPSGSSSGSAVAVSANLCAVAVGTETDGSILSPSSYNGIVGLKPTVGLISRAGIIPIAHSQDTAGPMTRSVRDAAILLQVLAGGDASDPATHDQPPLPDYLKSLDPAGLRGARIGVCRAFLGSQPEADRLFERSLETLRSQGATLIDPVTIPSGGSLGRAEFEVLLYEFKADLNAYLSKLPSKHPVRSLTALIQWNESHRDEELSLFGQELFLQAESKGPLTDPKYLEALKTSRRLSGEEGIDALLKKDRLDALVAPTTGPAHVTDPIHGDRDTGGSTSLAAASGYPSITVPAGLVRDVLPVGISFFAGRFSEPTLLRLAYAFEQATQWRRPPRFLPQAIPLH